MATKEKAAETNSTERKETWEKPAQNPIWHFWSFTTEKGEKVVLDGTTLVGMLEKKHSYIKDGKAKGFYSVKADNGNLYTIFGTTLLDRELEKVQEGTRVKIVYSGKEKNKKGGQTHMFEVFVATPF